MDGNLCVTKRSLRWFDATLETPLHEARRGGDRTAIPAGNGRGFGILTNEALPQTDEACFVCGSDRQFMTSSGRTKLR